MYTMTHVSELLRVKAHVIRYWEQEIPLIRSGKDKYGRRVYSARDMQLLLRLKHLLYNRRFTIEGAREELYRELAGNDQDLKVMISLVRSKLMDMYFLLKRRKS